MTHADGHAGSPYPDDSNGTETDVPGSHADADHVAGHDDDAPGETLGPVDLVAWAYAVAGGAIGLVTAAALVSASTA
jgi:hypothetical protein